MSGLLQELNRRNVFRVGIAYVVAAWVLLQVVDVLTPILQLPEWTPRFIFLVLAVCLIPALIVAWAYELTPDGLKRESDVDRDASDTSQTGRKLNNLIVATLAIAVAFLLFDRSRTEVSDAVEPTLSDAEVESLPSEPVATKTSQSIAVLPFVNMSNDEDFFSDGITEEILNALAGVRELKVAGRTSAFAFKGKNEDLRAIGEALGVEHILEGSVRKDGDMVRITAQLIQVEDGFHLWSETYDRQLENVFAIQDEISNEILDQLSLTLLGNKRSVDEASRTDAATYQLYLRAKQKIYTRERAQLESAVEDLNTAIARDPGYAPAFAQRGIAAMLLSETQYGEVPFDEANRRGERFMREALNLDPDHAEVQGGMGLYYGKDGTTRDEAIEHLTRALEINPSYTDARNWLQIALSEQGRPRDALEMLKAIADIDPMYMPAFSNGITMFAAFNEESEAEAWINRLRAIDPDNDTILYATAVNHSVNGRIVDSLTTMRELQQRGPISGARRFLLATDMLRSGQYDGMIEEDLFYRTQALLRSGDEEAALAHAKQLAGSGWAPPLLEFYSMTGRSNDLISYIEEGWPSLEFFASEYPGDVWGYQPMINIALAYKQSSSQNRFNEALSLLDAWELNMVSQGAYSDYFLMARASLAALRGERDEALEFVRTSVDEFGWSDALGIVGSNPSLAILKDEPELIELERTVRQRINAARMAIDLPPLDEPNETDI